MNLPNQLTVSRFVLTGLFVASMSLGGGKDKGFGWYWDHGFRVGFFLFLLAALTDFADGFVARRLNLITRFGKLMDPLADKVLMAAGLICLLELGARPVPAWAVVLIITREFAVTGLRLLAASHGVVLAAEELGKQKTVWQTVTVLYLLGLLALWESERSGRVVGLYWWAYAFDYGGWFLMAGTLLLTLISGVGYFGRNLGLLSENPSSNAGT
jgi:CDP-diacylglycerol--glycerol-3-phosphate 3-phosphatidyltransferase